MVPNPAVNRTSRMKPREAGYLDRWGCRKTPRAVNYAACVVVQSMSYEGRIVLNSVFLQRR